MRQEENDGRGLQLQALACGLKRLGHICKKLERWGRGGIEMQNAVPEGTAFCIRTVVETS